MQERAIEKKVCDYAKKTGWLHRKLQWVGRNGAPDRFFAHEGKAPTKRQQEIIDQLRAEGLNIRVGPLALVELKQTGKKPTEVQAREHERLREAGVEVYVVDSVEGGKALLNRLLDPLGIGHNGGPPIDDSPRRRRSTDDLL